MSPVNDDVMVFVVLAAGLRPVMAPMPPRDGNIDIRAVPESTWRSVGAVLTTNVYGMPDDVDELRTRCDRMGIPLLEDAVHAIGTTVGDRPIGTFGTAAWGSPSPIPPARVDRCVHFVRPWCRTRRGFVYSGP